MKKYHIFRTCLFFILLTIVAAEESVNNGLKGEKTTATDTTCSTELRGDSCGHFMCYSCHDIHYNQSTTKAGVNVE